MTSSGQIRAAHEICGLDGMRLSIKGAFGKNQGFRAFTASHSNIFALSGQSLLARYREPAPHEL